MSDATNPPRKNPWRFLPIALIAAGLALALVFRVHEWVSLETLHAQGQALDRFVAANLGAALAIYTLIYIAAVTISLPGAIVLTLSGGFLFGAWLGGAAAWLGASIGATLIFLAARTAFGDALRARAGSWLEKLRDGFRDNAFSYLLVLRLVPLFPFFVVNLVPAFLGVRLRVFAIGTLLGIIPGTFVYASVGAGLGELFEAGGAITPADVLSPEILAALVGLALLALLPVAYKTWTRRRASGG